MVTPGVAGVKDGGPTHWQHRKWEGGLDTLPVKISRKLPAR